MEKIDLYIHSYCRDDAYFLVSDIFSRSEERDLSIISISNHNSYKAALDGINCSSNKNIGFLTGIEVG